ncbi:hypothetical protein TYRP_023559 [Tyrophagus putrescentiae]|nr:hypothetical protein TYRP_023559 [Tyrophagus putrescentiae]
MKDIEVLMIANRSKLKLLPDNGLPVLLNKLKSELETNRFFSVPFNGRQVIIEVCLSNINGDNLQINEILGFKQSFNNNSFVCRYCGVGGNERQSEDTIHQQDRIYDLLTEIPPNLSPAELKAQFGIMKTSIFENFNGINRFNICPPDLAHDLAEGVVLEALLLILRSMATNHLSQQAILENIAKFEPHLYEGKPEIKPDAYNSFSIKSKAVQNLEIFLKLPAIFFEVFNTSWQEYQLYRSLKEFILITFSPVITRDQALQLKTYSIEIINLLTLISNSIGNDYRIHCKVHHLTHYSNLVFRFGPLFLFSTFRFERKHQFSKNLCRKIRNTRNLAYTLHTRHQIQKAFEDKNLNFRDINFFLPLPERTTYYMNPPSNNLTKKTQFGAVDEFATFSTTSQGHLNAIQQMDFNVSDCNRSKSLHDSTILNKLTTFCIFNKANIGF